MDLQEVGGIRGDWMELDQDRDRWWALVSTILSCDIPIVLDNMMVQGSTVEHN